MRYIANWQIILAVMLSAYSMVTFGQPCASNDKFIKYSAKYCISNPSEKTFILLDGSDGFSAKSEEWVKQNIFNNKKMVWVNEGAELSIARLGNKSVADMDMVKICTPKHIDKIDWLDAPAKVERENAQVYCSLSGVAGEFLSDEEQSNRSSLVEAITEVFKNPRYNFDAIENGNNGRRFFFVSDLFQNSINISFHKLCKVDTSTEMLICPSFDELISSSPKSLRYLTEAMPSLNGLDEVHIYNINVDNRVDQSARKFWEQYFIKAGAIEDNIHYRAELDG